MILISLVGDFSYSSSPILYQYKNAITKHIIIADIDEKNNKKIKRLFKGEKELQKSEGLKYKIISLRFDEESYKSIIKCYKKIIKHCGFEFRAIYFDATDGLGTVAVILSQKLLKKGATVLSYDSYDNNLHILKKNSLTIEPIQESLSIKKHLWLRGYKVLSYYHLPPI